MKIFQELEELGLDLQQEDLEKEEQIQFIRDQKQMLAKV